jgi:hypothetical protein
VKEDIFIKKDHPEMKNEKKTKKAIERCYPDLSSWWMKRVAQQMAENKHQ